MKNGNSARLDHWRISRVHLSSDQIHHMVQPRCYMQVLLFYPYISGAMTSPGRPLSSMATLPTATQSWKGREWMRKDP